MTRIAVFTKNLSNPAYAAARLGAERAAQLFGAQVLHFVPQQADDPAEQSALIDAALAQSPDAFVLSPVHATRVDAAIGRIHAAGIALTAFVNPVQAAPCVTCDTGTMAQPGEIASSRAPRPYWSRCACWQTKMKRCGRLGRRLSITTSIIGLPWIGISGLGSV